MAWIAVLLVVVMHAFAWWISTRWKVTKSKAAPLVWMQSVAVPEQGTPSPAAASKAATAAGRRQAPMTSDPTDATLGAVDLEPEPVPEPKPALDLTPESLGRMLGTAHGGRKTLRWEGRSTAETDRASGAAHLSETTGASGSRVTRVETGWSTYCIRAPQPGRPPPTGAAPELALPTNCP